MGTHTNSAALFAADPRALGSLEPTSPRSVEACLRLGIEPASLQFRPLETFQLSREAGDLAQLAFNFNEAVRQARLDTIQPHLSGRTAVVLRLHSHNTKSGLQHRQVTVQVQTYANMQVQVVMARAAAHGGGSAG